MYTTMTNGNYVQEHPIDTMNSDWDSVEKPPFAVKIKPRSKAHIELIKRIGVEAIIDE